MSAKKRNARTNRIKLTPREAENVSSILHELSIAIQRFTENAIYAEHEYNGKKFSHKDNRKFGSN